MSPKRVCVVICVMLASAVQRGDELVVAKEQSTADETENFGVFESIDVCLNNIRHKQTKNLAYFRNEMDSCTQNAIDDKVKMSYQTNGTRNSLLRSAAKGCDTVRRCEGISDSLDFFNCYVSAINTISKELAISKHVSSKQQQDLKIRYKQIDIKHSNCIITARKSYAYFSTAIDHEMQKCINGSLTPPKIPFSFP